MEVSKKKKIMEYNEESENSINDSDEYNNIEGENILLKNKKKQIKKDIKNFDEMKKELEKYKGKNISYNDLQNSDSEEDNEEEDSKEEEEENNEEEEEENMEENEDDDNYNEKENIEKEEDDNNMKPNILNDDDNKEKESEESVDEEKEMTLQEKMEKQDEQYLKTLSKVTKDEIRKAKNIINQKELYETFVGIRIALQNLLSDINSLPSSKNFSKFLELSSKETQDLYQKLKLNVNSTFYDTIIFHKEFLKKQNYPKSEQFNPVLELEKLLKKKEDFNEMDEQLNKIHNNLFKIDQKIMNIWYRKTVVNQFQTNNKIIKKLSNNDNFCEHVLSSVENNMNTLLKKTQKYNNANDNNIQLLGRKRLSAEEYEYDKEIFNDNDFYNFLLKEFLLNNEKEIDENNYVEKRDENGLVEGRYDLTMRYILNRNTKIKKNVDTKATKNRKIRYDKHEEIINFMVPENNDKEISGRNIIINSLFGTKKMNIDVDNKENEEKRENEKIEENDIDLI